MGRNSYYRCRTKMRNQTIIGRHCSINALPLISAVNHTFYNLTTECLDSETEALDNLPDDYIFIWTFPITNVGLSIWIGASAVVLQRCRFGHCAMVAAGAIITKTVAPFSIVVGVPARSLNHRLDEARRVCLLRSPWWYLPQDLIRELPRNDVARFLQFLKNYFGRS